MASLQATNGETTFGYVNGVDGTLGYSYYVADGATCNINGVTFPRSVQGNITCGAVNAFTSFYELSAVTGNSSLACHYVVDITAPVACLNGVPTGSNGGSTSSSSGSNVGSRSSSTALSGQSGGGGGSSLSGGAIAGIVIGSVVGATLLLAIMIFICCGIGAAGLRKGGSTGKSVEGQGVEHSGKFAPQEESRVQSEVAHETDDGVEMAPA